MARIMLLLSATVASACALADAQSIAANLNSAWEKPLSAAVSVLFAIGGWFLKTYKDAIVEFVTKPFSKDRKNEDLSGIWVLGIGPEAKAGKSFVDWLQDNNPVEYFNWDQIDEYTLKQKDTTLSGSIKRIGTTEKGNTGRTYSLSGYVRGDEFAYAFWSTKKAFNSHGICHFVQQQQIDHTYVGYYYAPISRLRDKSQPRVKYVIITRNKMLRERLEDISVDLNSQQ